MGMKMSYITTLLVAGAAAAAIVAAPTAAAAPSGTGSGSGTVHQSPGNVEINDAPPAVSFHPYGDMPYLLGSDTGSRR